MLSPRSLLPAVGLLVGALTLTAAPAHAADSWDVPRNATIVLKGHGYGHGHGMSQHGAEGAARDGLTYREIADFYYPGTSWGRAKGRIRVQITGDTTDDLVVLPRPGLRVRDLGSGTSWELPENDATRWRVTRLRDGRNRVTFLRGGSWRGWRVLEGLGAFSRGGDPVPLVTPTGTVAYRGTVAALAPADAPASRVTVNTVRLEQYLRGVVPLEIPALWSAAAVQAQAVAARTYAAYGRAHPRASIYDLCDTWSCQVYGGVPAEHQASDAAVRESRRRILRHDGGPAFTQFSSSSGGWTSAGSVPYLVSKKDPYDDWNGNPHHDWKVTFGDGRIESAWPALGNLRRIVVVRRDGGGQWGGRVTSVRFVGSRNNVTVSGDTLRSTLGLKSTYLTFRVS